MKVEIDELESLLGPDDSDVDFRRIIEEARDKKKVARCLRPSAQRARLNSWWSVVRDGTSIKRGCMRRGDTRLSHQLEDSGKQAWKSSGLRGSLRKER